LNLLTEHNARIHISTKGAPLTHFAKRLLPPLLVCSLTLCFASGGRAQSFLSGAPIDGVHCDRAEGTVLHIHQHLFMYNRGSRVTVPGQIGIPPAGGCLYWLHTHSDDGIIHVESPVRKAFTLGQFFDIWGEPLTLAAAAGLTSRRGSTLKIWVNKKPFPVHSLRSLVLTNKTDIVIMSGPPFRKLPPPTDWKALNL